MKRLIEMDVDEFKLALRFSRCRDALEVAMSALEEAKRTGFFMPETIRAYLAKTLTDAKEIELK